MIPYSSQTGFPLSTAIPRPHDSSESSRCSRIANPGSAGSSSGMRRSFSADFGIGFYSLLCSASRWAKQLQYSSTGIPAPAWPEPLPSSAAPTSFSRSTCRRLYSQRTSRPKLALIRERLACLARMCIPPAAFQTRFPPSSYRAFAFKASPASIIANISTTSAARSSFPRSRPARL